VQEEVCEDIWIQSNQTEKEIQASGTFSHKVVVEHAQDKSIQTQKWGGKSKHLTIVGSSV
jgi:hypothetical protein